MALLADGLRAGGGGQLSRIDLSANGLTAAVARPLASAVLAWYASLLLQCASLTVVTTSCSL